MIKTNDPGKANGELAAWIDGKLYIHKATQDNTVWYDDVALSTGYLGPTAP